MISPNFPPARPLGLGTEVRVWERLLKLDQLVPGFQYSSLISISDSMVSSLGLGSSWSPLQAPLSMAPQEDRSAFGAQVPWLLSVLLEYNESNEIVLLILLFLSTSETGFYTITIKKVLSM